MDRSYSLSPIPPIPLGGGIGSLGPIPYRTSLGGLAPIVRRSCRLPFRFLLTSRLEGP